MFKNYNYLKYYYKLIKKAIFYILSFVLMLGILQFNGFKIYANSSIDTTNSESVVLDLSTYDVDESGYQDSGLGIYNALLDAKRHSQQGKQVILRFPHNASYTIKKEFAQVKEVHTSNTSSVDFPNKHIAMLIEGINNLTIEGNGSELIIEGDMMALGIFQSQNITIRNLSWDHRIPTTSEMTIFDFDVNAKTVDYFIPKYFDYEIVGNGVRWKSEKDSNQRHYWTALNEHRNYGISVKYPTEKMGRSYYSNQGPFQQVSNISKLENGLLRITYRNFPITPVKGMNYQLVANAIRPTSGALVWESKDVSLEHVRISYMHGFGFLVQMSENVSFDGIKMETDVRTGKNTSSYADGIHISGAKGKIVIKNSFFNNTHDDPINIHGTFTRVEEKINNKTLRLNYIHKQQGGFQQFYPGDKVVFYSRDTLESKDQEKEYTVKTVQGPDRTSLKTMIVEFEEDIPDYVVEKINREPKYVAENITYTPEIEIRNNHFLNVFTRHILVTSRKKVIIDGNHFEASSMPAIFFSNDSDEWYESGPIRDLEITNNVFKIRSIGRTWWKYSPAIYFHPVTKGAKLPNYQNPIHKNILIQNNTFYLESDGALRAESVENLRFENNKIYRLNPNINLTLSASDMKVDEYQQLSLNKQGAVLIGSNSLPSGPEKNSGSVLNVLEFQASKNVVVRNNYYDDGLKKYVLIENMPTSEYMIEDDLTVYHNRRENHQASEPTGKIYYVSTNPKIASVDQNGKVFAHKQGTTDVYAYTIYDGRLIESNRETIEVHQKNDETLKLDLDEILYVVSDDENQITVSENGNVLRIDDVHFESLNPEIIEFNDNHFTIYQTGIAEVKVSYANKVAKIFILANHRASQYLKADYLDIENENSRFTLNNDSFTIIRNSNEDLWERDNNLTNLVRLSLQNKDVNNFAAMIEMDGLPLRQARSWDSAYFILFKLKEDHSVDRDNYISVGKRAHSNGFATVKEENGRGSESQTNNQSENQTTRMRFVIEKQGNNLYLYALVDDEFQLIHHYPDVSFLGDNLSLGVGSWGNTQSSRNLTVSNFKLVEGSKEDLLSQDAIPFKILDTTVYDINNIRIENNQQAKNILKADNANSLKALVVYKDQANLQTERLNLEQAGDYKIYVIHQAPSGKLSYLKTINHTIEEAELNSYINGIELTNDLTLDIPDEINTLVYRQGNNYEFIDIDGLTSIEKANRNISLNRMLSSKIKITSVKTSLGNPTMLSDNQFIYTDQKDKTITINITSDPVGAVKAVYLPDHNQTYEVINGQVEIPIYNGVNSFEIIAYALDNKSTDVYRLHILRNYQIQDGIKEIRIKNEIVNPSQDNLQIDELSDFQVIANADNATISYYIKNEDATSMRVLVKIQHEDKLSCEYQEYTLTKNINEANADYSEVIAARNAVPNNLEIYTLESVERLNQALANVLEGKKISKQLEVDAYARDIKKAIAGLILKAANLIQYDLVKLKIPSDLSKYTKESVDQLKELLAIDVSNKTILQQAEVDNLVQRINDALYNLVRKAIILEEDNIRVIINQPSSNTSNQLLLIVEAVENPTNYQNQDIDVYHLALQDENGIVKISDKRLVYLPLKAGRLIKDVIYIDENQNITAIKYSLDGDYVVFEVDHFSLYAVVYHPLNNNINEVIVNKEKKDINHSFLKLPNTGYMNNHYFGWIFILSSYLLFKFKQKD